MRRAMVNPDTKNTVPLPMASRLVFETDDLLAARDHLSRFLGKHSIFPTQKGARVEFRHNCLNIGCISIHALHYGADIRIHTRPLENTFYILMLLKGHGAVSQDMFTTPINQHNIYVFNPLVLASLDLSQDQVNFTISIPESAFRAVIEQHSGRVLVPAVEFMTYLPDADIKAAGFRKLIRFICSEIDNGNNDFNEPLIEKQLEQLLPSLLLMELPHNNDELMGKQTLQAVPGYIQRVEAYIAEHYSEQITLSEMAKAATVSERALQNGLRRFRNSTPMTLLRDYRLYMARHQLESRKHTESNITNIASRCGFTHLGKFAACYRQRFGEAPSDTRNRFLGLSSDSSPQQP